MSAMSDLLDFAASVGRLEQLAEHGAAEAAPLVEAEAKQTAAAGTDPYGTPWPLKKDGTRALKNAADHVSVHAAGAFVVTELEGVDNWHQDGAQGKDVRRVIPDVEIPDVYAKALDAGCVKAFDDIMKGAA